MVSVSMNEPNRLAETAVIASSKNSQTCPPRPERDLSRAAETPTARQPSRNARAASCHPSLSKSTASKKQVIFAWFEDKKAVLKWYYSAPHQRAIAMSFPGADKDKLDTPLQGVPDDVGPIMAIASITLADKPMPGSNLPFSQISIELYKPVTGGIFIGGRFAPDSLKVPNMKDYTPKKDETGEKK